MRRKREKLKAVLMVWNCFPLKADELRHNEIHLKIGNDEKSCSVPILLPPCTFPHLKWY